MLRKMKITEKSLRKKLSPFRSTSLFMRRKLESKEDLTREKLIEQKKMQRKLLKLKLENREKINQKHWKTKLKKHWKIMTMTLLLMTRIVSVHTSLNAALETLFHLLMVLRH